MLGTRPWRSGPGAQLGCRRSLPASQWAPVVQVSSRHAACLPAHRGVSGAHSRPANEMNQQPEVFGQELRDMHTCRLLRHAGDRPDLSRTFLALGVGA